MHTIQSTEAPDTWQGLLALLRTSGLVLRSHGSCPLLLLVCLRRNETRLAEISKS